MNHLEKIISLLRADSQRMKQLAAVRSLGIDNYLVAAGFVRNLIWDHQHDISTPLNDVDVIYFDICQREKNRDLTLEKRLLEIMPEVNWSVKNQARMHSRNGDKPYRSNVDAMAHWPEKQTAIGVRLEADDSLTIESAFDLQHQFNGLIEHNSNRPYTLFHQRLTSKNWLKCWPKLRCVD